MSDHIQREKCEAQALKFEKENLVGKGHCFRIRKNKIRSYGRSDRNKKNLRLIRGGVDEIPKLIR